MAGWDDWSAAPTKSWDSWSTPDPSFSSDALKQYRDNPNATIGSAPAADILKAMPKLESDDPLSDRKGQSLMGSVSRGEQITDPPVIVVDEKGNVIHADGRHRTFLMGQKGNVPVVVLGLKPDVLEITGAQGKVPLTDLGITPQQTTTGQLKREAGLTARAAVTGLAALPVMVGDVANTVINKTLGTNLSMPSERIQAGLTALGVPEAATQGERLVQAGSQAMAGAGGQIGLLNAIAKGAPGVLSSLASNPAQQAAAAASGGIAQQQAAEMGAGPGTQTAAGFAGSMVPSAAAGLAGKALRPIKSFATPPHEELVKNAEDMGFKILAGAQTRNKRLQAFESTLGTETGGVQEVVENNKQLLAKKAMAEAGITGEEFPTANALYDAARNIGSEFKRLTTGKAIALGQEFKDDLKKLNNEYVRVINTDDKIAGMVANARELARNRAIDGQEYQRNRTSLQRGAIAAFRGGDANAGRAISAIVDALDKAAERSLTSADIEDFQLARKHYRNLLVLEDTLSGAKEARAGTGDFSPNKFAQAVERSRDRRQMAKTPWGEDTMVDLARVSSLIPDSFQTSGTSERQRFMRIMRDVASAGVGGAAGSRYGEPVGGAMLGALAGETVLPALASRAMLNPAMQNYLARGVLPSTQAILDQQKYPMQAVINALANIRSQ